MLQGFGVQTKNIDELIKKIEQEIAFITKNIDKSIVLLNNKLTYCSEELQKLKNEFESLKTDTEAELNDLENRFEQLFGEVEHLRDNCIKVEFNDSKFGERVASGIAPLKEYDITHIAHPIYAKYADKDVSGRPITDTYLTSASTIIDQINEKIATNSENISSMSAYIDGLNTRLGRVENTINTMNVTANIPITAVITKIKQTKGKIEVEYGDNAIAPSAISSTIIW